MKTLHTMLTSQSLDKHQEFILAFEKNAVLPENIGTFCATKAAVFKRRADLEVDRNYAQALVYAVFYDGQTGDVLAYQRTKGVGESRLVGKKSIGIGGHVDLSDVEDSDSELVAPHIQSVIETAVFREFKEEMSAVDETGRSWSVAFAIHASDVAMESSPMLMLDTATDGDLTVEQVHLGIVVPIDIRKVLERMPGIDSLQVTVSDEALISLGMVSRAELSNTMDDYECWSQLAILHMDELISPTKSGVISADHSAIGMDNNVVVYRP